MATKLSDFEAARAHSPYASDRQLAEEVGVPRTTLQDWHKRKQAIDAPPEVVAFFESPAGVAFLHRLVLSAHVVMPLMGSCGIRLVCRFLELSGLSPFVGASYGTQQQLARSVEAEVNAFGEGEAERLSEQMSPKQISVCQDETFHPQPCLVAIEPVSNFILVEQYAQSRSAQQWTTVMQQAVGAMPIDILQSTSDEAKGICRHVKEDLGVHHAPDLMHVQADLVKATSASLAAKTRQAQTTWETAHQQVQRHQQEKAAYHLQLPPPRGRPPDFDGRIQQAKEAEAQAQQALEEARSDQAQAKQAIQDISTTYHPYDLESGTPNSPEDVAVSLAQHLCCVEAMAHKANLSQRCFEKIHKAKGRVGDLVATLAFFFWMIQAKVEALELAPDIEQAVYEHLIPGLYLSLVAEKAQPAQEKHRLRETAQKLLAPLLARDGPFAGLDAQEQTQIQQVARECAELFQRSSSCVEGRNGQLSLRHHHLHQIRAGKLKALTTVHNYFIQRPDGTTAAERFFGAPPSDLFQWLLERVELPGRPARKRPQQRPKLDLMQALA